MKFERPFTQKLRHRLRDELSFIQVVIGPRQVGKTTALQTILAEWKGPALMVSADEVGGPTASWLELQWLRARNLGPGTLLVIDEVQKIDDWSRVVKYLFDQDRMSGNLKVVLLGSASLSIQRGLSESLAGRYELLYAPHWTFLECRDAFGWDLKTYLTFGGYPGAATIIHDPARWKDYIKHSIIEPVLSKDILSLVSIHKPALFRQCFELAVAYPAQEVSLQKLLGQLQEGGNVTTIRYYLDLFEGAFLLKSLQKYSGSHIRSRSSSPKLLPLNTALTQAITPSWEAPDPQVSQGRLLEAAVGSSLSLKDGNLYYWRDGKYEVDYIFTAHNKVYAIEVKSHPLKLTHHGLELFLKRHPKAIPIILTPQNITHFLTQGSLNSPH